MNTIPDFEKAIDFIEKEYIRGYQPRGWKKKAGPYLYKAKIDGQYYVDSNGKTIWTTMGSLKNSLYANFLNRWFVKDAIKQYVDSRQRNEFNRFALAVLEERGLLEFEVIPNPMVGI